MRSLYNPTLRLKVEFRLQLMWPQVRLGQPPSEAFEHLRRTLVILAKVVLGFRADLGTASAQIVLSAHRNTFLICIGMGWPCFNRVLVRCGWIGNF